LRIDMEIYELKTSFADWTEVTKEEWIKAERSAGFYPKCSSCDPGFWTHPATSGFSSRQGIEGRILYLKD